MYKALTLLALLCIFTVHGAHTKDQNAVRTVQDDQDVENRLIINYLQRRLGELYDGMPSTYPRTLSVGNVAGPYTLNNMRHHIISQNAMPRWPWVTMNYHHEYPQSICGLNMNLFCIHHILSDEGRHRMEPAPKDPARWKEWDGTSLYEWWSMYSQISLSVVQICIFWAWPTPSDLIICR